MLLFQKYSSRSVRFWCSQSQTTQMNEDSNPELRGM